MLVTTAYQAEASSSECQAKMAHIIEALAERDAGFIRDEHRASGSANGSIDVGAIGRA